MRKSVDFPQPDGPTIVTNSFGCTSSVMSWSACVPSGNDHRHTVEPQRSRHAGPGR